MPWGFGNEQQTGMELIFSNFEAFQNIFFDVIHTETFWQDVIPQEGVLTDIDEGATSTSYGVKDWSGKGAFMKAGSQDVPTVGISYRKDAPIPIYDAGVSGCITRADVRNYAFAHSGRLDTDLTGVMGMACDKHVEGVIFYGDNSIGFPGWLDLPEIEVIEAPLNSGGTSRKWEDKTPDEILYDINLPMMTVRENTKEVFIPGAMYLPGEQFDYIATTPIGDNKDKTILDFVKGRNVYTFRTGKELKVKSIPHLEGAAGAGEQRAVFQTEERPRECFGVPFPIMYRLLAPVVMGYETRFFAEYKFGRFYKPRPETAIYLDKI